VVRRLHAIFRSKVAGSPGGGVTLNLRDFSVLTKLNVGAHQINEFQNFLGDGVGKILCFHYLIYVLLPILKQVNTEKDTELETKATVKGIELSKVDIKQDEFRSLEHCWYAASYFGTLLLP
uniref:Uncharacterized protein n=1 Tax=Cucumis melo TaxID=3656 RepID=A0A9I9E8C9_CUCME